MCMHCLNQRNLYIVDISYFTLIQVKKEIYQKFTGTIACWRATSTRDVPTQTNGFSDGFAFTRYHMLPSFAPNWTENKIFWLWLTSTRMIFTFRFYFPALVLLNTLWSNFQSNPRVWSRHGWVKMKMINMNFIFIGPRCSWGLIYGSVSPKVLQT